MEKTFATTEYENKLLDEILRRVARDIEIRELLKWDKKKAQKIIEQEMLECYSDPVFFIENYLFTDKNPFFFSDRIGTKVPYLLFDYQVETIDILLECVEKWERAFIEKSRQLGLSWLVCAFALWWWLFRDWKMLFLSQKEDYVDKVGDMQSLFQKIRFMTRDLPRWMLPKDFSMDKHMPRLRIYKPDKAGTGSIIGESANTNAGTWWTYKFVFMDEMAKMDNAKSINTAVQATTWCIIYNSTPLGKFCEYYRMRILAVKKKIRHIRLHWSMNPMYTKEWYTWKTQWMFPEQIAQELEINYEASVEWRVYPTFANKPTGDCMFWNYEYDPYLPLYISIDNSHWGMDNHAIIVAQTTPNGKIRIIDSHQFPSYTTITECASLLAMQPVWKFDDNALKFLDRLRSYKQAVYIADPYDSNATWDDTSIIKIYRNYWITLNVPQRKKTIEERIRIVRMNMERVEVNVDTENSESLNWEFVSAIQNARFKTQTEGSESTTMNYNPIHDGTSHFRSDFEYLLNFIIEAEESMGIVWWMRQKQSARQMIQKENYITGELEWVYVD